jgi:hypothetical protein
VSARSFPESSLNTQVGTVKAVRITCAECGGSDYFQSIKAGKRLPPVAAIQYWTRQGWRIGSNPRKDACPNCAKREREKPMAEIIELKAEPPRQMSREERRIINDKLDEVYGRDAYKQPWTDARVATDLGIPRAWVEDVRQQFFGEAGSNPLIDDYLAAESRFATDLKELNVRITEAKRLHDDIDTWRVMLSKQADELSRIGKRIEKEIGR